MIRHAIGALGEAWLVWAGEARLGAARLGDAGRGRHGRLQAGSRRARFNPAAIPPS